MLSEYPLVPQGVWPLKLSRKRRCVRKSIDYLHEVQKPTGGWVGSWGICFTYSAQFALESLALVGETYETSKYSRKGCDFLIKMQRDDGGWGESYKVSTEKFIRYCS